MAQANPQQTSFTSEIFAAGLYKKTQGRVVRQVTAAVVTLLSVAAAYQLYFFLVTNYPGMARETALGISAAVALVGAWLAFRLVNWPRFADFLIAVEAELNKVTWPTKDELKRASVVVMVTIFILALSLAAFDIIWQVLFRFIGVVG